jgi:hypothetical protein
MNILQQLVCTELHPYVLKLLFKQVTCILGYFGLITMHKFMKIHMNTYNFVY